MSLHHLGEEIDIHGGGNDLVFPHHENEIAQSESLTGKCFARYWVHNGMMQLGGEAMSKSTGNVFTIEEFLSHYEADVLRILILNSSYRSPLTFNDEVLQHAKRGLERMRGALRGASPAAERPKETERALMAELEDTKAAFEESMDDDFNTAGALSALFELVRSVNQARDEGVGEEALAQAQDLLRELAGVLGLRLDMDRQEALEAASFIELLIEVRDELRDAKQWPLADLIRDRLGELGIILEDLKDGTVWKSE